MQSYSDPSFYNWSWDNIDIYGFLVSLPIPYFPHPQPEPQLVEFTWYNDMDFHLQRSESSVVLLFFFFQMIAVVFH